MVAVAGVHVSHVSQLWLDNTECKSWQKTVVNCIQFNCGIENLSNLIVICEIGLQLLMWSNSVAKTLVSSSNFGVLQVSLPLLVGVEVVLSSLLVSGHVLIGRTLSLAGELVLNCNRTKSKPELTIFYDTTSSWPDLALALALALAWTGALG